MNDPKWHLLELSIQDDKIYKILEIDINKKWRLSKPFDSIVFNGVYLSGFTLLGESLQFNIKNVNITESNLSNEFKKIIKEMELLTNGAKINLIELKDYF